VDDAPDEGRFGKLIEFLREFAPACLKFSVPVGALQAAEAICQYSLWKQTPHGATDQRTIDAFNKVLFGRNAEAVGDDIDVGGRIAHLDTGEGLLGRLPVAKVVNLRKTFDALIAPHAI